MIGCGKEEKGEDAREGSVVVVWHQILRSAQCLLYPNSYGISLQKARLKLPSWYKVSAILPPLALEQCSSEATAKLKSHSGKIALDLEW